jgi:uncharacterized protein (TIGR02117 family)
MKKYAKYLLYLTLSVLGFVLIYLGCAYCLSRIAVDKEPTASNDVTIYIKTNGVHTDVVVPVKNNMYDWSKEIKYTNTSRTDTTMRYLAMGWGDKGFYLETPTWGDLTAKVAFKAAFALGATAIHTTFYSTMQENETCKKTNISAAQYQRLINNINNSLQKDANGHLIHIKTTANYGNYDAFYEANGSYSMLHTCNTWANNGLKKCGQKACLWTPFDTGIFLKYE